MKRKIARLGTEVSALGMGCWAIGGPFHSGNQQVGWGNVDDAESERAIRTALDLGVTFFDTADVYGAGHSERVVGRALGADRSRVVIATKFANLFDETTKSMMGSDASPDYVHRACEASLRRLETDYIDILQLHDGGLAIDAAAETREALERLVTEGKIRGFGWSTDDTERAQSWASSDHCVAIQFQLNVLSDNAAMRGLCEQTGMAGINRGPLAMGLLSGKYENAGITDTEDVRGPNSPDWMRFFEQGKPSATFLSMMNSIREILTSEGRSLVQGALAWLWGRSERMLPIPGFKTVEQVTENAKAMEFGPLSEQQIREIDRILERD